MLYQLRNLSEEEKSVVLKSPIWVTLLIACSDQNIEEGEIDRAKEIMHIKSFATNTDVKDIYKELDAHIDDEIDIALKSLSANGDERIKFIESHLSKLNDIFPKMEGGFAKQLYKSLRSLAFNVAKSDGGFFGIGSINDQEEIYIKLPMLDKQ
jgi:hypothetical protein